MVRTVHPLEEGLRPQSLLRLSNTFLVITVHKLEEGLRQKELGHMDL